jgi:hypothetical protein
LWLLLLLMTTFASTAASAASVDSGIITLRRVTATGSSGRDASVTKDDIRASSRSVSTVWRCRSRRCLGKDGKHALRACNGGLSVACCGNGQR